MSSKHQIQSHLLFIASNGGGIFLLELVVLTINQNSMEILCIAFHEKISPIEMHKKTLSDFLRNEHINFIY